ncbi:GTPase domain-containing protein [Hydrogenophaga sp.]|uniref:GTPase n=1 Tax=Hydrogenophaga sp. TaxID=1904254 RepID=UPI0027335B9D|nr:GTPase domain-containing protein [Hydrogenophaga sp.]MDP3108673.1 GTPase domain-containing protein [Hydrogenophaga sp.]
MPSGKVIRVLVFGSTGVGKTSLCNTLTGRNRPTNNGPFGVTQKTHAFAPFVHDGRRIQIIDTAGMHESDGGTVKTDEAVQQIVELLQNSKDGFHLLIHVARATRITKEQEEDHDFFVRRMTQSMVPSLMVLTGCENEEPMTKWVDEHRSAFNRYNYKDLVATCFAQGGKLEEHYAPLREQSREVTLDAIVKYALSEPYLLFGGTTGRTLQDALYGLWNEFVDLAKLPAKLRRRSNESAYALLKRLGVPEKAAALAIKHIPDLMGEIGDRLPFPAAGKIMKAATLLLLSPLMKKKKPASTKD